MRHILFNVAVFVLISNPLQADGGADLRFSLAAGKLLGDSIGYSSAVDEEIEIDDATWLEGRAGIWLGLCELEAAVAYAPTAFSSASDLQGAGDGEVGLMDVGLWHATANLVFHLSESGESTFDPTLTVGFGGVRFDSGAPVVDDDLHAAFVLGAGINLWMNRAAAVRFDVRGYLDDVGVAGREHAGCACTGCGCGRSESDSLFNVAVTAGVTFRP